MTTDRRCLYGSFRFIWSGIGLFVMLIQLLEFALGLVPLPENVQQRQLREDKNRSISYLLGGTDTSRRLIYVHGTPGESSSWISYIKDPIDNLESIALDRPGFGGTRWPRGRAYFAEQARAIEPFLVKGAAGWPVLVGHSLGAPIITRAAIDFPDRIGGLVIISGSLDPGLEKQKWYNLLADTTLVRLALPRSFNNSNDELKVTRSELTKMIPSLSQIRCPILIIHDINDRLVPVENVDFMKAHFPARLIWGIKITTGKDHFVIWNDKEEVRAAIRKFVESLERTR